MRNFYTFDNIHFFLNDLYIKVIEQVANLYYICKKDFYEKNSYSQWSESQFIGQERA